ncbi:hypothetical protein KDH_62280 [Dictyobacter sp. S3.2.2.5]|uniref:Uncharacterized protein n=1 Tax=Dictyobacter halimunensis TaxID=3026934 RepID=A0ABQ6FYN9_9CHLR|nr:hypothetical protein KDH_62280 [Dictyobacter sp. S3.2.2.5]
MSGTEIETATGIVSESVPARMRPRNAHREAHPAPTLTAQAAITDQVAITIVAPTMGVRRPSVRRSVVRRHL